MKSKKKKIILSILLAIILLLISFSVYYVIDNNKGEYRTRLEMLDNQLIIMPIPKWSKVIAEEGIFILKVKSHLKQEELEKFYKEIFYDDAKKVVYKQNNSRIAYYDTKRGFIITDINFSNDNIYTICTLSCDVFSQDQWKIVE